MSEGLKDVVEREDSFEQRVFREALEPFSRAETPTTDELQAESGASDAQMDVEVMGGEAPAEPTPMVQEPIIMRPRTLLRETFMRLWRVGQQMQVEGVSLVMLCSTCHAPIQVGLQGAQIIELKCLCTVWSIRAIHV